MFCARGGIVAFRIVVAVVEYALATHRQGR